MRISARCDYACRALLELALHWPDTTPLRIRQISDKQNIPDRYLVQILIQLKRAGIVASSRGKQGGYNLASSPEKISFGKVLRSIAGPILSVSETAQTDRSVFNGIWAEADMAMSKVLDNITFKDICDKIMKRDEIIAYQI